MIATLAITQQLPPQENTGGDQVISAWVHSLSLGSGANKVG